MARITQNFPLACFCDQAGCKKLHVPFTEAPVIYQPSNPQFSICLQPQTNSSSTAVAASTQPDIPDVRPDFRPNPQSPMSRLAQGVADLLRAHHASSTYPVSSTTNSAASLMVDMVFGFLTALRRLFGL
jgi:hypothetical protein